MAADAEFVLGIGMFEDSFRGIADLVLPGTSYLERDGKPSTSRAASSASGAR